QRLCGLRLVGAELEQLGEADPQALTPGRLASSKSEHPAVEPLARLHIGLDEAVLPVREVLVEGRAAGLPPLDHVLDGDLLVSDLAADQQNGLEQALSRSPHVEGRKRAWGNLLCARRREIASFSVVHGASSLKTAYACSGIAAFRNRCG